MENINTKKNIIIIGKSVLERRRYMNEILLHSNLEIIRFPKEMKSFDDYIETIRKNNLFHPSFPSRTKYNSNQILNYHIDWIAENNSLFVFEEFHNFEEKYKMELLRIYTNNLEQNKKLATRIMMTMTTEFYKNLRT